MTGDRVGGGAVRAPARPRRARSAVIAAVALLIGVAAGRFVTYDPAPARPAAPAPASTPADRIASLERATSERPTDATAWQQLGIAYTLRSIQTGDPAFYELAERALDRAARLDPTAADTTVAQGTLLLSLHRFSQALEAGQQVLADQPRHPGALAVVVDAQIELGRYEQAATTLQRLLDTRPDLPALARASHLRQLHGDLDGALTAIRQARTAASPSPADLADVTTIEGEVLLLLGRPDAALRAFDDALRALPSHALAELGRAKAQIALGEPDAAVETLDQLMDRRPIPAAAMLLGELHDAAGKADEAARAHDLAAAMFDLQAQAGQDVDLEAALFAADHGDPANALALATTTYEERATIHTADALAWALHRNGRHDEAAPRIDEALALGTLDPQLLVHAAVILHAAGQDDTARDHLSRAIETGGYLSPALHDEAATTARALDLEVPPAWR